MSKPRYQLSSDAKGLLSLRDMQGQDLSEVLKIERTAQASPWSRLMFEEALSRQQYCRVLIESAEILGFHVVSGVVDELHILNVVVAKQAQGSGLGHWLLQDILQIAKDGSYTKLFLEVRASNLAAQGLYQKWQFQQIALRKNYYAPSKASNGEREDALLMMRAVDDPALVL